MHLQNTQVLINLGFDIFMIKYEGECIWILLNKQIILLKTSILAKEDCYTVVHKVFRLLASKDSLDTARLM